MPSAISYRAPAHDASQASLSALAQGSAIGVAPARQPADHVLFRHAAAVRLSLRLRYAPGQSRRAGAGAPLVGFSLHRHFGLGAAIPSRTRQSLSGCLAAVAARSRRAILGQNRVQFNSYAVGRVGRHSIVLDLVQFGLVELAT